MVKFLCVHLISFFTLFKKYFLYSRSSAWCWWSISSDDGPGCACVSTSDAWSASRQILNNLRKRQLLKCEDFYHPPECVFQHGFIHKFQICKHYVFWSINFIPFQLLFLSKFFKFKNKGGGLIVKNLLSLLQNYHYALTANDYALTQKRKEKKSRSLNSERTT